MKCKICNSPSERTYETIFLNKFPVSYFKCRSCNFIQTEEPYWLQEAYSSAITSLDIGLVRRNMINYPTVKTLINLCLNDKGKFVDYGGGYGMFTRIMRDEGFDYYRQDIYCENLFAKNFDITDLPNNFARFDLLTAFEVFEHLVDPNSELDKMLELSNTIFFSTSLHNESTDLTNWWYLIPETGQHIALYSKKTFEYMAKTRNLYYYTFGDFHLFTKEKLPRFSLKLIFNPKFQRILNRLKRKESLLQSDFNSISDRQQRNTH